MSALDLPRAAQPFVSFPTLLRANGFAAAPEQTTACLQAVGLLGPRSIEDVRRSAYATLDARIMMMRASRSASG